MAQMRTDGIKIKICVHLRASVDYKRLPQTEVIRQIPMKHLITRKLFWTILLGSSLLLSACGAQSAPAEQAPTAQTNSVAAPTQPANPTPAPPTSTAAPAATPTAEPTNTPEPPAPTAEPTDAPPPPTEATAAEDGPGYSADIQPIFDDRCIKCHSGNNAPRGLSLDSYENALAGGTYRPVITPGQPAESELVKRIKGEAIPRMPFDGPPFLSEEQITLIVDWIAAGALK
ncbi:MAG TPA: hypothetical protein ENK24_08480 [Anaerolineae bacterium]|nr:hypothetical protein [Anaerolineae bacterium]